MPDPNDNCRHWTAHASRTAKKIDLATIMIPSVELKITASNADCPEVVKNPSAEQIAQLLGNISIIKKATLETEDQTCITYLKDSLNLVVIDFAEMGMPLGLECHDDSMIRDCFILINERRYKDLTNKYAPNSMHNMTDL